MADHDEVRPDCNIHEMPYAIYATVCDGIDLVPGLVSNLMAKITTCRLDNGPFYALSDIDVHAVLSASRPCDRLFTLWASRGMIAQELVFILDMERAERPLLSLIDPMPLTLIEDVSTAPIQLSEGDTLKLRCFATGFPYPRYCWFRAKTLITQNDIGQLEISDVGLNATGTYICRIHNRLSNRDSVLWSSKCVVHVEENLCRDFNRRATIGRPGSSSSPAQPNSIHFTKQLPENLNVKFGEPLELAIETIGPTNVHYLWCKNQEALQRQPNAPKIKIEAACHADRGKYQCTVYTQDSTLDSKSTECQVTIAYEQPITSDSPIIIHQPTDIHQCMSGIAVFVVEAECMKQPLHYQWYHNNKPIINAPSCNELSVDIDKREKAGFYYCRVYTDSVHGRVYEIMSHRAKLVILPKKTTPRTATDKLAIIFGQSNYLANNKPLPAVKNDLYEAYSTFNKLGFKTIATLDSTLSEMWTTIQMAIDLMTTPGNHRLYVVLCVIGHGFRDRGLNYLMPTSSLEGPSLAESLCIEEVAGKLNKELNPVMYFQIADICQTEIMNVMTDNGPQRPLDPMCNERVVFWAASPGQESLEENCITRSERPEGFNPTNPSRHPMIRHPGWTNITNGKKLRGIFSKGMFQVLMESSDSLILQDLYKAFNDVFVHPNPNTTYTKGKEQNPVNEITLHHELSLADHISVRGQEEYYEKRKMKYDKLTCLSPSFIIPLSEGWVLRGKFVAKTSNVMELILYEDDNGAPANHKVQYNINTLSVPEQLHPCECYVYPDDVDNGIKQKRGYMFYNLNLLQHPFQMILEITITGPMPLIFKEYEIHAGYPLIANMTHLTNIANQYSQRPPIYSREACENSDDDKLSSLESSI